MVFEYAFASIETTDAANVSTCRGDKYDIVEENIATVREVPQDWIGDGASRTSHRASDVYREGSKLSQ